MTYANKSVQNFSGGEVAPGVIARIDLPLATKILQRMENFIADPKGPSTYRNGTQFVHHTRRNNFAVFIEFQFSDAQAYLIEATEGYFRFYKDEALILNSAELTITGISKANPGVLTYTGTDPTNGQEVYLSGIVGMTELNGRYAVIANVNAGANTFQLTDEFGNNIDTSGYTTYVSGGTAGIVYEVITPYLEEDLMSLMYAQTADVMYIDSRRYAPRKLTRTAHDAWTLVRYSRASDPFEADNVTYGAITGVTQANPGVVSDASHTFAVDDEVFISGIVGMTELNNRWYKIATAPAGSYTLKDHATGSVIDTTGYTAYSSGGTTEKIGSNKYPGAIGFTDDARLCHAGTEAKPESLWFSQGPTTTDGITQFEDFGPGSASNSALYFTLAPIKGKVDSIRWITSTDKYIAAGTFGSIRRLFGATEAAPVGVDEITAKGANSDGVYVARPVSDGPTVFYIGRSGQALETLEYDYQIDGYAPDDKNLVSDHLTQAGLRQIARQLGRPTIIWAVRADGVLLGLTYKAKENIAGWHRHYLGGDGIVENIGIMPRENNQDQLWLIVKRTVNGQTTRSVEFMKDAPVFPVFLDFYTGPGNFENDRERFENYQSEVLKQAVHLDNCLTYDGSSYGANAAASITMGEDADIEDQTNVTVTASAAVFTSDMVGREIWGAYTSEGIGGGRLTITGYTSSTVVTGTITDSFPATATYEAGDWYITATSVSGLHHLEGATVAICADGVVPDDMIVENASISLDEPASVIHVGFRYRGIMQSLPLDQGGVSGPAQSKPKIISKVAMRFINACETMFGSNMYNLTEFEFRRGIDLTGRPTPLYTGIEELVYEDSHENEKVLFVVQETPLPCTVAAFDIYTDTSDE